MEVFQRWTPALPRGEAHLVSSKVTRRLVELVLSSKDGGGVGLV